MGKEQITVRWPKAMRILTEYGFKLDCIGGISFDGVQKEDAEALIDFMEKRLKQKERLHEKSLLVSVSGAVPIGGKSGS